MIDLSSWSDDEIRAAYSEMAFDDGIYYGIPGPFSDNAPWENVAARVMIALAAEWAERGHPGEPGVVQDRYGPAPWWLSEARS